MRQKQKKEKIAAKEAADKLSENLKDFPWFIGVLVVRARHTGLYGIYQLRVFSRVKSQDVSLTVPGSFQGRTGSLCLRRTGRGRGLEKTLQ